MDNEQKAIKRIQMASDMSLHHYGKPLVCHENEKFSVGQASQDRVEMGIIYKFQQKGRNIDNSLFRKATDI